MPPELRRLSCSYAASPALIDHLGIVVKGVWSRDAAPSGVENSEIETPTETELESA
jgi:hypothetical protein